MVWVFFAHPFDPPPWHLPLLARTCLNFLTGRQQQAAGVKEREVGNGASLLEATVRKEREREYSLTLVSPSLIAFVGAHSLTRCRLD